MKQKAYCKHCDRPMLAENNFLVEHDEPESSSPCYGSGAPVDYVIPEKMAMKEFLQHCMACGGNWTAMLASGVKKLWPAEFAALPETFTFKQAMDIVKRHVDVGGPTSTQEVE